MTNQELFAIWSPETSIWATWAKPVLFAHLNISIAPSPPVVAGADVSWSPTPEQKIALILDLPGEQGLWTGLALAGRGYRPVPLYNAVPVPFGVQVDPVSGRSVAAVDVLPIMNALHRSAEQLVSTSIPFDAPPVFLLDANRHGDPAQIEPAQFDNRSICLTTDFPSANFLLSHGIERVWLIQQDREEPQEDLAHVLRRWQDGGLLFERLRLGSGSEPRTFVVSRPSWYGAMFQRALSAMGLRRAPGGGFGAWMPESSAMG